MRAGLGEDDSKLACLAIDKDANGFIEYEEFLDLITGNKDGGQLE